MASSPTTDPNLLVGFDTADDAAVYRLRDDLAIVVTTDFFTPIVDDAVRLGPHRGDERPLRRLRDGRHPAARAESRRLAARRASRSNCSRAVLDGGAAAAGAAGLPRSRAVTRSTTREPKYGLAVVGTVDPDRVLTNAGAQPGDVLVLTKPIGLGVISTAVKHESRRRPSILGRPRSR